MKLKSCLEGRYGLWCFAVLTPIMSCLFCAISVFAQLPTGTILGVVKDPSGAVVAGATVTSRNVDTGLTRTSPTEADGSYRFVALPAGNYEVEATHEGFQTVKQSGITLAVGQEAVENITLQIGSNAQTVEVTTEAPLVNTTNGVLGDVVNEQKVQDLPLNGRNYAELTLLQPGVTRLGTITGTSPGTGGTVFSSNGAPIRSNSYFLDGAPMSNLFGQGTSSVASTTLGVDGIKEFRIVTNSFSAEYGLAMGSVTTVVTKGGTNQFHGDAFEYLRNSAMDATNFFDPTPIDFPGKRIAPLRRNQFGGSFGGPIRKDKTFFYATYEALRQVSGAPDIFTTFPTNCYSSTTHLLLATGNPCATSTSKGAPPVNTVAPVVQPFLQFFPYPNLAPATTGGAPRYGVVYSGPITENYGQIRVDHNFSSKDSFFGRYTTDDAYTNSATNPQFVAVGYARSQYATLGETHILSPTLLNAARFSVTAIPLHQTATTFGQPDCPFTKNNCISNNSIPGTSMVCATQYGAVTGNPPTGPGCIEMGSPSITGITSPGYGLTNQEQVQNTVSGSDDVFYTKGKHAFKFGTLIQHYQDNIREALGTNGSLSFTTVPNFFAGLVNSYSLLDPAHGNQSRYYRFNSFGFYAQDDMRLTPRLTFNLGLRYEFDTVPTEKYGISSAFLNLATATATSYVLGPPFRNPSLHNFSPRLGFAWDIFGDGKTSLRGGFAELYDIANFGGALIQESSGLPPFSQSAGVTATSATTQIPAQLPLSVPANYTPSLTLIDYYQNQPHMLQYNLSIERQLPGQVALTVSYAGSRGMDLWQNQDANPKTPIPGSLAEWPLSGNTLFTTNHKNPNLASISDHTTTGDSYYNSLQVSLIKQLSHRLQFQSSYTYSRSIDNGQGEVGSEGQVSDPLDLRVDRGPTPFDVTHYWKFNAIYTLPNFTEEKVLGKLVNEWRLSGIESLETGYPFTPTMNTNTSGSGVGNGGSGIDRPSWNPNFTGNLYPHTFGEWFNPAAFIAPPNLQTATGPAGVLGNVGRDSLRGPGLSNLDFSVSKQEKVGALGEAGAVAVRVDSFNIFNHPNFASPTTTAAYNGTSVAGSAGLITTTAQGTDSRRMQISLTILF